MDVMLPFLFGIEAYFNGLFVGEEANFSFASKFMVTLFIVIIQLINNYLHSINRHEI